mgnify:FL=1|jgi:hypothetical protein
MNPFYTPDQCERNVVEETNVCQPKNDVKYAKEIQLCTPQDLELHKHVSSIPLSPLFFSPILSYETIPSLPTHVLTYREELTHPFIFFNSKSGMDKILYLVSSFRHIVQALDMLHSNGVHCIDYEKIGYHKSDTPRIYGFRNEPHPDQLHFCPMEYHLLTCMKNQGIGAFSRDNIHHCVRLFFQKNTRYISVSSCEKDTIRSHMDCLVDEFSFLVNKPLSFLEDVVEKNSDKAYVYGIGVFFAEMVHQYDFDMVPDELVFLINRCRSVSLKFRPSLHDVMKELEQFG